MPFRVVFALLLLPLLGAPALAVDRAEDAAEFAGYVKICADAGDAAAVERCLADQVGAKDGYLGDIVAETDRALTAVQSKKLASAQVAFVDYRARACAYQTATAAMSGTRTTQFCLLRLTNQRIADVLEGSDFLALGN